MQRFASFCAALGLAAVGAMASVPTAQASTTTIETGVSITSYSDCPAGWFCAYEDPNGLGRMARFQLGSDDLRDFNLNDQISSVWNRRGLNFCTWLNIQEDGGPWEVGNWQGNTSQYNRDNNISSLWVGGC